MLKILIKAFKASKGRMPNALEMLQLRFKAAQQAGKGEVIEFPPSAITDWTKPRPTTGKKAGVTELDAPLINEFARTETLASPTRIKQGFSTQSKLNSWAQNQKWVKDFIGRKNREFNSLNADDQKKVLDMFEVQIKKHMPKEPKAYGGIAGMLGEPTYTDENHRVPLKDGTKFDPTKRTFLKDLNTFLDLLFLHYLKNQSIHLYLVHLLLV